MCSETRLVARLALAGVAVLAAFAPIPAVGVEFLYARAVYPSIQRMLTGLSNLVPFALLDVLIVLVVCGVAVGIANVVRNGRTRRLPSWGWFALNLLAVGSLIYLVFLCAWGLNYRREPVTAWTDFDEQRVTADAASALAATAVDQLVRLRASPSTAPGTWPSREGIAASLKSAFARSARDLGLSGDTLPGRPKTSALDVFFTWAGTSGMTDPFFLETLTASNLLPFEQPAVIAHEWAHLAGLARESEASFLGWLACAHADERAQYSGWLDLFLRTIGSVGRLEREALQRRLPQGVKDDLDAMARRNEHDQIRLVSLAAWRTYDAYLRANRVESGVRNYNEVVRLILGTRFHDGWRPVLRPSR